MNSRDSCLEHGQKIKIGDAGNLHGFCQLRPEQRQFYACQMKEAVEKQLTEPGCQRMPEITANQINQAGRTAANFVRACRKDVAQVQSMLDSEEQKRARLQKELDECKQYSSKLHREWQSRLWT